MIKEHAIVEMVEETIKEELGDVDVDQVWIQTDWEEYSMYVDEDRMVSARLNHWSDGEYEVTLLIDNGGIKEIFDGYTDKIIMETTRDGLARIQNYLFSGLRMTDNLIETIDGTPIMNLEDFIKAEV